MPIRHTDVLVIGGELAGALAAAVCARAGRRVLVLEEGEGQDGEVIGGVIAPPIDDLWPSLEALPRALAPLEALGQKQDIRRTMPYSPVSVQVLHPEHRLDLFHEAPRRIADLRREAGIEGEDAEERLTTVQAEADAAGTVVDTMDPLTEEGFFATRRVKGAWRDAFGKVRAVRQLDEEATPPWLFSSLRGALPFLAPAEDVPPALAHRLLKALVAGVHVSPIGGRNALRAQLLDAARQRGAEIIRDERAAALVVDSGRISEVRLSGRNEALTAKAIIDATWTRDFRDRISPEKHAKKLDAVTERATVARVRAGVLWLVKKEALPPGLGDRALLCADGDGPGSGVALLSCVRAPLNHDTRKPMPGLALLSLCAPVTPSELEPAYDWLGARLDALFPFTRRHLVESRNIGSTRLQAAHGAIYAAASNDVVDLGGRGCEAGLKALFRAGRDVAPWAGVEGELWSGHAAAIKAERVVGKKPLFGRQSDESAAGIR